jgi:hypothetical protein
VVACCLWFSDADGPLDAVHLASMELDEWSGLAEWVPTRSMELPALAGLLSVPLPVVVRQAAGQAGAGLRFETDA